jgi:Translation machinery-associated protein 16
LDIQELPDLTHAATVELFRKWENGDPAYLHLLQFVRLSSTNPTVAPIVKYGLQQRSKDDIEDRDVMEVDVTEKTGPLAALQRAFPDVPLTAFSSTIQNMDSGT